MPPSDRAGQPATPADLVDVPRLVTAYYAEHPDVGVAGPAGRLRHLRPPRLVAEPVVQLRPHRRDQPGDLRATGQQAGTDGPLFLAKDTHALSEPAFVDALEVFAANGVRVLVDSRDTYTPTPGAVARDPRAQPRPQRRAGRRRGGHPVAQPAAGRRLQVQPAQRRAGRHRHHPLGPGPGQRAARRRAGRRPPGAVRAGPGGRHHGHVRLRRTRTSPTCRPRSTWTRSGPPACGIGADPLGGAQRAVLGGDRLPLRAGPDRGQPAGRPDLAVHDAGLGRQDPDGLLLAVRDGLADRRTRTATRSPPATTPTPTGTASSPRTPGCSTPTTTSRSRSPTCTRTATAGRAAPRSARRSCRRG